MAWSAEEEAWIVHWLTQYISSPYYNTSKINWKKCERDLRASQDRELFENEHLDATKIMECAKRIAKREKKSLLDYVKGL